MTQRLEAIEVGNHAIAVYRNAKEKFDEAFAFLKIGLDRNEVVMLITDELTKQEVLKRMSGEWNIDAEELAKKGDIIVKTNSEWYFPDDMPNTKRTIALWIALAEHCLSKGKKGLRVVGDTSGFFKCGFDKELIEYEGSLEQKFNFPITAICAYEDRYIDGLTLEQIATLRDHHSNVWMKEDQDDHHHHQ